MDKNKYSSDMEKEIRQICTELNDGKIAVVQATEKLLDLFNVVGQSEQLKLFYKYLVKQGFSPDIDDDFLQQQIDNFN